MFPLKNLGGIRTLVFFSRGRCDVHCATPTGQIACSSYGLEYEIYRKITLIRQCMILKQDTIMDYTFLFQNL
jgi:hypothetical protein